MSVKIIKDSKKIELFKQVVSLFEADQSHKLNTVIPGAYRQTYGDSAPTDADLVCVGHIPGCAYYVPKKYARVFNIRAWGYWDNKLTCPVTGEEVIVSEHLGNSAEAAMLLGGIGGKL